MNRRYSSARPYSSQLVRDATPLYSSARPVPLRGDEQSGRGETGLDDQTVGTSRRPSRPGTGGLHPALHVSFPTPGKPLANRSKALAALTFCQRGTPAGAGATSKPPRPRERWLREPSFNLASAGKNGVLERLAATNRPGGICHAKRRSGIAREFVADRGRVQ